MRSVRHIVATTVLLGSAALGATPVSAGDAGDAGALFLRIGVGARAAGMGEAFTGVAKDASSVYWNPGAMAAVQGTNVLLMHNEYLQSLRTEQAALTHETDYGTLGLLFTGLYMDDMDRRGTSPGGPFGQFAAHDIAFAVGFSRYIIPNLSVGVTGKWIHEKIDETTANGWAVDLGVYHIARIEGVRLAAVVTNLGPAIRFKDEFFQGRDFALPRVIKLGGSWSRDVEQIRGAVLVTADVLLPNDGDGRLHIGGEYGYDAKLFLRGGFKRGYDSQGATFGLGVVWRRLAVDYAWLPIDNDLGDSHRVSLGFTM